MKTVLKLAFRALRFVFTNEKVIDLIASLLGKSGEKKLMPSSRKRSFGKGRPWIGRLFSSVP